MGYSAPNKMFTALVARVWKGRLQETLQARRYGGSRPQYTLAPPYRLQAFGGIRCKGYSFSPAMSCLLSGRSYLLWSLRLSQRSKQGWLEVLSMHWPSFHVPKITLSFWSQKTIGKLQLPELHMHEARVGEVQATCQVCLQENVALLAQHDFFKSYILKN